VGHALHADVQSHRRSAPLALKERTTMRWQLHAFVAPAAFCIGLTLHAANTPAPQVPAGISTTKTSIGPTFVEGKGMTLYYYDLDQISPGESSCTGDCAAAWPPLLAAADAQPVGDWTIIKREDGARQWTYQSKPLYLFTGDAKPGEVKGDGMQRFWHAAKYALPPPTLDRPSGIKLVKAGEDYVLANHQGKALYSRTTKGACDGECAAYPRLAAPALAQPHGDWKIITDRTGFRQWAYKGRPLYAFEGDSKPGDRAGESNDGWLAVTVE
jgi:predicted lipoprotein with Yx(FWY)xxD motif